QPHLRCDELCGYDRAGNVYGGDGPGQLRGRANCRSATGWLAAVRSAGNWVRGLCTGVALAIRKSDPPVSRPLSGIAIIAFYTDIRPRGLIQPAALAADDLDGR